MSSWQQPILTSNGAWGVDDFAVRGWNSDTYLAFDGTNKYLNGTNTDRYIEIWIKDGLALSNVALASSDGYLTTHGIIAYSDDGESYTDCGTWSASNGEQTIVVCTNHDVHKYFRLTFKSACDYKGGNADISNITLIDYATSISTTPVALTFDGKTNFAKIPVSLTDTADWSAEITFETDGKGDSNWSTHEKNCLFGQDDRDSVSGGRDFHVDVMDGNLYIYCEKENSDADFVNTKIKVADGKQHTVKIVSNPSDNGISVYCDGVYANTVYIKGTDKKTVYMPTPFLGWNGFSKTTSHLHFSLHSFKLTKNGSVVAEYAPTEKEVALRTLTDKSGNGNDAALYGNTYEYKAVDILFNFLADTARTVQATTAVEADTCRTIAAHLADFDFSADTARTVHRAEIVGADTGRTVQSTTTINADAARKTVLPFEIDADTNRTIAAHLIDFSFSADTSRTIQATTAVNADISRAVEKTIAAEDFDAMRAVQVPFTISADTTRKVIVAVKLDTDTLRTVERVECVNGDSIRYLVFNIDKLLIPANQPPAQGEFTPFPANPPKAAKQGVISMTLELATGTLSDTLNFETFGTDFTPKRAIRGTFLDFPYEYRVEQVANIGGRQKVTSMSYIDRLLYVPLKFYVEGGGGNEFVGSVERSSFAGGSGSGDFAEGVEGSDFTGSSGGSDFESLAKALAKHLGYACETHMENIYLKTNYSGMTVTYSAVMSGAFGWLSDLPWRQVNVYIKGGTMCFVQRGQEPNVYDITNLHHDEPTIVQKVFRSRFSANNKTPDPDKVKPAKKAHTRGFSGSITYPNWGYTNYDDGLPTDSLRHTENADVYTWWHYDLQGRLVAQESRTEAKPGANINDSETETRIYYYPITRDGSYTVTATHTKTTEHDSRTGKSITTETVNYAENAKNGTTSTTVRDGDMVTSNGPASVNTGSEFSINQQNILMTNGAAKWLDDDGKEIKDEADISFSSLPVSEAPNSCVQLSTLVAEINSHDRCIEETVEMNILEAVKDGVPSLTHVINFGERIKYKGNEYCLERNTVTRTAREIKQNIVMIRWFDLSEGVKG